jgi:hypothetical protein
MTKKKIQQECEIQYHKINEDMSIDVIGDVITYSTKLPLQFNIVKVTLFVVEEQPNFSQKVVLLKLQVALTGN